MAQIWVGVGLNERTQSPRQDIFLVAGKVNDRSVRMQQVLPGAVAIYRFVNPGDDEMIVNWEPPLWTIPGLVQCVADPKVKYVICCVQSLGIGEFTSAMFKKKGIGVVTTQTGSEDPKILSAAFTDRRPISNYCDTPIVIIPRDGSLPDEFVIGLNADRAISFIFSRCSGHPIHTMVNMNGGNARAGVLMDGLMRMWQ